MQLRPEIQIKSVLKALADVVVPAIDPTNQLALEQVRLCMGLLQLMSTRLPLQFRFDLDELARLAALADALGAVTEGGAAPPSLGDLRADAERAHDVLRRAQADPAEVAAAVRALRASTSALVGEACAAGSGRDPAPVERLVMSASHEQLLRDRSWLLPQGWEPAPEAVPAIESLLAPAGRQA